MPLKQSEGLLSGYRAAKEQEALKKKAWHQQPGSRSNRKKSAVAQIWRSTLAAIFLAIRILATIALVLLAIVGLSVLFIPTSEAASWLFWRYRSTNSKFFRNLAIYA